MSHPIDGQVVVLAGAKASVPLERLPGLLEAVAVHLEGRAADYERRFERVVADEERRVYLVPRDHWAAVGEELGMSGRETDAVRRAHVEQLRRVGRRTGRREEFDHALDIRSAAVLAP
jgi:hypothetical protein